MGKRSPNQPKAKPTGKIDTDTRVDRWLRYAKNHPWIAVPVFLAIVAIALSSVAESGKKLSQLWEDWRNPPNDLLVEPLTTLQPGFDIDRRIHLPTLDHPKAGVGPELDISWIVLLSITNLREHPLVIKDFAVTFNPDPKTQWRLVRNDKVLDTYVAEKEDSYREEYAADKPFQFGSIIIPPSSKRYVAFRVTFDLYDGQQRVTLTDAIQAKRAVLRAIGGDIDDHDVCNVTIGPIDGTFEFTNGGTASFHISTALFVPGCFINSPVIKK